MKKNLKKKSHKAAKTEEGRFSSPGMVLREKRGKNFLVLFARPNDSIWDH